MNFHPYLLLVYVCQLSFPLVGSSLVDNILDIILRNVQLPGAHPVKELIDEAKMEATKLIQHYGYPVENHTIRTSDNYFLISHRIFIAKKNKFNESRVPVVLLHSLSCESSQWFDDGPTSLAFYLAEEGYDVWAANFRGTAYSYHAEYEFGSKSYWNFSVDDYVFNDFPAIIDHVLAATGHSKLLLIGHSLGATVPFMFMASKPEYNAKIACFVAMAPTLEPKYVTMIFSPLLTVEPFLEFLHYIFKKFDISSIGTLNKRFEEVGYYICPSPLLRLCELPMYTTFGYSPYLRNRTRMSIFGHHCSNGMSGKTVLQFLQSAKVRKIRRYDYGPEENKRIYAQSTPPAFNLSKVTMPTVIFHAPNDCLATPLNIVTMSRQLPNLVARELFPNPTASHGDFIWSPAAKELVYYKVIKYLKQFWK